MAQEQKARQNDGWLGRPYTVLFTVFCCWSFACLTTTGAEEMSGSALKALKMEESDPHSDVKILRGSPPLSVLLRMKDRATDLKKANPKIKSLTPELELSAGSDGVHFENEVLTEKDLQLVRPGGPGGVIGPSGQVQPPVRPVFPPGPIGPVRPIDPARSKRLRLIGPSGPVLGPGKPVFPPGPIGPVRPIDPARSKRLIGPSGPVIRPPVWPVLPGGSLESVENVGGGFPPRPIGPVRSIDPARSVKASGSLDRVNQGQDQMGRFSQVDRLGQ